MRNVARLMPALQVHFNISCNIDTFFQLLNFFKEVLTHFFLTKLNVATGALEGIMRDFRKIIHIKLINKSMGWILEYFLIFWIYPSQECRYPGLNKAKEEEQNIVLKWIFYWKWTKIQSISIDTSTLKGIMKIPKVRTIIERKLKRSNCERLDENF